MIRQLLFVAGTAKVSEIDLKKSVGIAQIQSPSILLCRRSIQARSHHKFCTGERSDIGTDNRQVDVFQRIHTHRKYHRELFRRIQASLVGRIEDYYE